MDVRNREGAVEDAARQILRALRGRRSQVAFSRRLGFASNVAADWENGRRYPRLSVLLERSPRLGVDLTEAVSGFHRPAAHALAVGVGPWLRALAGSTRQTALAERAALSRHQVGRWLAARAEPRLPDLLRVVDAATGRAPDLAAAMVPIAQVPALFGRYESARRARRTVFEVPWVAAILPLLETTSYRALAAHEDVWVADRLGVPVEEVAEAIRALVLAGAARWDGSRLQVDAGLTVDTQASVADKVALRRFWAERGAERVGCGLTAFNVFAVPRNDLARIRTLQTQFYREVRSLVAAADPDASDTVGLVVVQVLDLTAEPQA